MSYRLVPAVLLGVLAVVGCDDATTTATQTAEATPSATAASTPGPSAASSLDAVMPDLRDRTFHEAQQELAEDLPGVRVTAAARHKDVTLAQDHDSWRVCDASPRPGTLVTADDTVVVELARRAGDCKISYHGYLHETNDPAYTPPQTRTPKPTPTRTSAPATSKPVGDTLITCSDGKQGYACTSNGHPVVDGQFCPSADHGRTLRATNGTMVTCSYDPSVKPYRWQ
ncbi:PASTA domain-containing protein [Streptomyces sp. bgisy027]|uniref:PASTA domain-containing protein n=1 Tax=Streptomyces sp. bgisy027 TaxID=3413770 RepID=UPI003D7232A1